MDIVTFGDRGDLLRGIHLNVSLLIKRTDKFFFFCLFWQDFLQSLDPPLTIPRDQLTRWHPEFGVDQVPEIEPDALPIAPNVEKCYSAKDVLGRS